MQVFRYLAKGTRSDGELGGLMSRNRFFYALLVRALLLLIITVASRDAGAFQYSPSSYSDEIEGSRFSIDELIKLVETGRVASIEQAIDALPARMRGNYALMYRSRSLQSATFQSPRAIVYEGDGSFVATFNGGEANARGRDSFETIQFRQASKRWEFREIAFSPGRAPVVSEINPRRCLECHQSRARQDVDPRPNWEPYSNWPGAYAGVDGRVGKTMADFSYDREKLRFEDAPMVAEQAMEASQLGTFLSEIKPYHTRYQRLGALRLRATVELSDILSGLNALRVARLVSQTPDWDVYHYLVYESVFCGMNNTYGSDGVVDEVTFAAAFLPQSMPTELQAFHLPHATRIAPGARVLGGMEPSHRYDILFGDRGIDTSDWSLDFKTGGRFAFRDRFGSPSNSSAQHQNAFVYANTGEPDEATCIGARRRAIASQEKFRQAGRFKQIILNAQRSLDAVPPEVEPRATVARCASCHSDPSSDAPPIPFDRPAELQGWLGRSGYRRGSLRDEISYRLSDVASFDEQMPPAGRLSPSERKRAIEWLQHL